MKNPRLKITAIVYKAMIPKYCRLIFLLVTSAISLLLNKTGMIYSKVGLRMVRILYFICNHCNFSIVLQK